MLKWIEENIIFFYDFSLVYYLSKSLDFTMQNIKQSSNLSESGLFLFELILTTIIVLNKERTLFFFFFFFFSLLGFLCLKKPSFFPLDHKTIDNQTVNNTNT